MRDPKEAREAVLAADKELALAFARRMEAARQEALCLKERGLGVHEADPEQVAQNGALIPDEELRAYYPLFASHVDGLAEELYHRIMQGLKVAYAGVEGAFAENAARRIFPDGQTVAYPDFRCAYEAVEKGECDCCVLPLENSYAGDVAQVMDLGYFGSLYINGVYDVRICQCLLGTPDATLEGITAALSHPQALSQCAGFLSQRNITPRECSNTAVAARQVAESADPTVGAIGSPEAAALYGLKVLASAINESAGNTTRFAVFSRVPHQATAEDHRFILTFTVKNEAGALARAISIIGERGFNMRSLKSRPSKNLAWSYYFYIEGEGDLSSPAGIRMMEKLQGICSGLKVLGCYKTEVEL